MNTYWENLLKEPLDLLKNFMKIWNIINNDKMKKNWRLLKMIEKLVCTKDFEYIGGSYEMDGVFSYIRKMTKGTISFEDKKVNGYARIISYGCNRICGFEKENDSLAYKEFLRKNIRRLMPRILCRCSAKLLFTLFVLYFIFRTVTYSLGHDLSLNSNILTISTCIISLILIPVAFGMIDSV